MQSNEVFEEAAKLIEEQIAKEPTMTPVKQVNIYDQKTGKLISTATQRVGKTFGVGWCMCKKDALRQAATSLNGAALRVLIYLYGKQSYGEYVMIGVNALARVLGTAGWRIGESIKQLEQMKLIKKVVIDGNRGFLLNPAITACGRSSMYTRRALWNVAEDIGAISTKPPRLTYNDPEIPPKFRQGLNETAGGEKLE